MATRDFVAGIDGAWGTTPGAANANWNLAFTPTSTDAATIGSGVSINVIGNTTADCASLDCTGFLHALTINVNAYGNVTFDPGMTADTLRISGKGSGGTYALGSVKIHDLLFNGFSAGTVTFTQNFSLVYSFEGGTGNTYHLGTNVITMTTELTEGEFYLGGGTTLDWSAGAAINFFIPDGKNAYFGADAAVNLPPMTIDKPSGTGTGTIQMFQETTVDAITLNNCQLQMLGSILNVTNNASFAGGSLDNLNGSTLNVLGNFSSAIDMIGSGNWTLNVTGTVTLSPGITITNCQATNPIDGTGCIDGGGNTNITFPLVTRDFVGTTDTEWGATPGAANDNWNLAFTPTSATAATIGAGAPSDVTTVSIPECLTLDCTGFTHNLGIEEIAVYGNVTLASGMTVDSHLTFDFHAAGTLLSVGKHVAKIFGIGAITVTIGDDQQSKYIEIDTGGTLALGANHLVIVTGIASPGIHIGTSAEITSSDGSSVTYVLDDGVTTHHFTTEAFTFPDLIVTHPTSAGSYTGIAKFDTNTTLKSLTQVAGHLDANGKTITINGTTVLNGHGFDDLIGSTLHCIGGINPNSTNLSGSGEWFLILGVPAIAVGITVLNCTASGELLYVHAGTDGGGNNAGVVFSVNEAWVGATDDDGGTDTNWSPAFLPDPGSNITFSGSNPYTPSNQCYDADFTGFTGTIGDGELDVFHNVLLTTGIPAQDMTIGFFGGGACSINTMGSVIKGMFINDANTSVTLLSDVTTTNEWVYNNGNPGDTLNFGVYKIIFGDTSSFYASGLAVTFSTGAEMQFFIPDGNGNSNQSEADMATVLLPPISIQKKLGDTGTGTFQSSAATYQSFTLNSCTWNIQNLNSITTIGDMSFLGGAIAVDASVDETQTVGGNFVTNISIDGNGGIKFNVTGTATAHNATIKDCDFSGGSPLDASDNCIDGGGNTNVSFVPLPTVWHTNSGDDNQNNASNYSQGLPDATKNVSVTGAGTQIRTHGYPDYACKNFDMSAFTGSVGSLGAGDSIFITSLNGDFTFGAGATTVYGPEVHIVANSTITCAGQGWFEELDIEDGTTTLADDLYVAYFDLQDGNTLVMGDNDLIGHDDGYGDGFSLDFEAGALITFGTSKILLGPAGGITGELICDCSATATLPPIEVNGAGDVQLHGSLTKAQSLNVIACGSISYNNLDIVGDVTLSAGNGSCPSSMLVGGDFISNAIDLNSCTGTVTGSAEAHNATISNCDFSGGTALDATDGCTDGGGNVNVNFGAVVNVGPDVNAGDDQTIQLPGTCQLAGSATDDGNPVDPGVLTLTWSKLSGPGDVTFNDASIQNAVASFNAGGTYQLRLSAFDGELTVNDDIIVVVKAESQKFLVRLPKPAQGISAVLVTAQTQEAAIDIAAAEHSYIPRSVWNDADVAAAAAGLPDIAGVELVVQVRKIATVTTEFRYIALADEVWDDAITKMAAIMALDASLDGTTNAGDGVLRIAASDNMGAKTILAWCEINGKRIVAMDPAIDIITSAGTKRDIAYDTEKIKGYVLSVVHIEA